MHDDPIVHVRIAVGRGRGPYIHLHARTRTIGRCREIRVVRTAGILRIGDHVIVSGSASSLIVILEISTGLIKSINIREIVYDVVPIEKIDDRGLLIF